MNLKLLMAIAAATAPIVVFAQQGKAETWKPTIDDAQHLVDAISGTKDKLNTYCEINKTHEQLDRAEDKATRRSSTSGSPNLIVSKTRMGPDYLRMTDGLGDVDPASAEGQKFTAVFEPLHKQCK